MKRLVALLVALVMALSIGMVSFAEETETESEAQTKVEQSVAELTASDEDASYKEYFESAFAIITYTRNCAVNIENFFYVNKYLIYRSDITEYAFLVNLSSPLELTTSQLRTLSYYKEKCSSSSDYKSYTSSTLAAALHFSKNMPAYLAVFALLDKPIVPEKYKAVDECIDQAITEATSFYDDAVKYLKGDLTDMPEYNGTYYDRLEIVNDAL